MFDLDAFVAECRSALTETQPVLAIQEALERALARPKDLETVMPAEPGVEVLHRAEDLTVLHVLIPPGRSPSLPHDHRMWALVGIYAGQEDNRFFRRAESGLTATGGRSLRVSDTLAMGERTVHAIHNPLNHDTLAALHVYGGDLVGAERSMWTDPGYQEEPYDDRKVLGYGGMRGGRQ